MESSVKNRAQREAQAELPDNVNKIREIIFGSQMREYERRFDEVSSRLGVEMNRLKSDFEQRVERIEALLRNANEEAVKKLQHEKRDRTEAIELLSGSLGEARKALTERLSGLDEEMAKTAMSLRNELHAQGNDQAQRLNQAIEAMSRRVDGDVHSLRSDKVARHDLGELLAELALRLKGEFELPSPK